MNAFSDVKALPAITTKIKASDRARYSRFNRPANSIIACEGKCKASYLRRIILSHSDVFSMITMSKSRQMVVKILQIGENPAMWILVLIGVDTIIVQN